MHRIILLIALIPCSFVAACGLFEDQAKLEDVSPERLVAFTAVYAETDSSGTPIERVILADYDNPSIFKAISDRKGVSRSGRFSPSKRQIIFGDEKHGSTHDPYLIRYEIEQHTTSGLYRQFQDGMRFSLTAPVDKLVWSPDEIGFFHTNPYQTGGGRDLLYYSFAEETYRMVRKPNYWITLYPIGLKGRDTLIVFSDEFSIEKKGPIGFYFMSLQGEYLGLINNPNLEHIVRNGIVMKGIFHLAWHDASSRFAVAYHDSTFAGYKIAVTDLRGTNFKTYTSGEFIDDHPRWGPDGKTILFDRINLMDHSFGGHRLMELDLGTGEVREFADPKTYGAVGLWLPDF